MTRKLPPIWLMGFANLPFSIASTIMLITVPQLLAAKHVPEPQIAALIAFALIPGFISFVLAPILDVRFSRRTYAIALAIAGAALSFAALSMLDDLPTLRWLLFLATGCGSLYQGAIGGWLGGIVPAEDESRLGAWFTVAGIAGFGLDAIINIALFRALPEPWGALAITTLVLVPLALLIVLPAPGPDRRLARESFTQFAGTIGAMLRRRTVIRTIAMFGVPAACFALTNMLGGIGMDFGASEKFVSLVAGIGVTFAGIFGSLIVPPLVRRFGPYRLYLSIGVLGALFSLSLILLARTPTTFAIALIGQNIAQAAAFTTAVAIIFHEVGKGNPLAATEFTVLNSAMIMPLSYVAYLDGRGYAHAGLTGALLTDGLLGLAGCAVIVLLLKRWPVGRAQPAAATTTE